MKKIIVNTGSYSIVDSISIANLTFCSDDKTKYYYRANEEVIAVTKEGDSKYKYNLILDNGNHRYLCEALENIFEEYPDSNVELIVEEYPDKDTDNCPLSKEGEMVRNGLLELINKGYLRGTPSGFNSVTLELKNKDNEFVKIITVRTGIF